MPNKSLVYEDPALLPGQGANIPFVKPQTMADPLPVQPKPVNPLNPQENMAIQSASPTEPDNMPLNTQQQNGSALIPQPAFAQPAADTMPQQAFKDKPMQPVKRNLFAKQTPAAAFTSHTPLTPPTQTYTPSASNPTQSVYDYLLAPSKEEQKLYKDNESKKRLLLLSDALRHIGNIYNTTKGATPQQFTSPVVQQEQQYQQKRNEIRAQRAAALKNSMDQAKLQADQNYKNSMLGMRAAELERGLANDEWNRQWNQSKWAGDQANKDREFGFKKANADRTFAETARHNRVGEGLRAQANRIAQQNANTSSDRTSNPNLKDYQPIKIAQGNTGYISKKWINSPEGRAEIKAMYNRMRQMKQRLPNGKTKELISEAKIKKDSLGVEPSTMDMLVAMQEGAWSQPYMDWIDKYALDPTGVNWTPKHPTYYKKVAKGQAPKQKPAKPQSLSDKYSKYERK